MSRARSVMEATVPATAHADESASNLASATANAPTPPVQPGTSFEEYLRRDARQVSRVLDPSPPADAADGVRTVSALRYTTREFHEREKAKLWPRVWQMACREEVIPAPGDYTVYDIVDRSFLLVRQTDGSIKAFYNSCLHRGRMLATAPGHFTNIRCAFHGFTWRIDGALHEVPCRWDFPGLEDEKCHLPEARVDTWGGWVFLNMAPDAPPLADYLGVLPAHFAGWGLDHSYVGAHVARVVPCNWKATMEAFSEAWHSMDTHPQILTYTGDTNTQYDVWPEHPHVDRMITPFGVPSPYLEGKVGEQEIFDTLMSLGAGRRGAAVSLPVPPGMTGRAFVATLMRGACSATYWTDMSHASDAELLDGILYNVFPNFVPWGGYGPNIVYRFRPNGDDHASSIMEVMLLMRHPKGKPKPPTATVNWLGADEPWTNARELGALGPIFDQDMSNLHTIQKGMTSSASHRLLLSRRQESRLRHLHDLIDRYLEA